MIRKIKILLKSSHRKGYHIPEDEFQKNASILHMGITRDEKMKK